MPNFHALFFTETASEELRRSDNASPGQPVRLPGRISLEAIWARVAQPAKRVFYLSGPPIMLNALSADLRRRAVAPDQIRTDAWE